MKTQTFGVEIELTGITRKDAAKVIADYYGTTSYYASRSYDTYEATDRQGRKWKAMSDGSIDTEGNGSAYSCEIVTPVCRWEDIEDIQEIVRQLRHKGAKANSSCGIHVHVGATYGKNAPQPSEHYGKQRRPTVQSGRGKRKPSSKMVQENRAELRRANESHQAEYNGKGREHMVRRKQP